eukprot:2772118-Ditylum_brightwellii.AAC.1
MDMRIHARKGMNSWNFLLILLGCMIFSYGGLIMRDCACMDFLFLIGPVDEVLIETDTKNTSSKPFHVRESVQDTFVKWSTYLHHHTRLDKYKGGEPDVNWDWHPRNRSDRFPSVEERVS